MSKFSELKFNKPRGPFDSKRARMFFPNGYGVSVVQGPYSYGGKDGLYEAAVIKGCEAEWNLCYDTPITDDVEGYLSVSSVEKFISRVEALSPPAQEAG